ncbi:MULTISPECIES: DUF1836 domain-containing protein [Virgibacillus]|uniref:DUF1836 domain-containing protein n=2 Tax=Virgibacillus TaxID=84406 RepID=A0A024Q9A1_9BACI|nr:MULTISPECIES: DUF1836 domain-containing protein [Virgibacillus]EQB37384.1 hypothetical protein M948_02245 [Virgibacillus sp. CM-4]MYL40136.1 DUF1836 domain-containing protein [Virgibacillus massiliensis]GGJ61313.1 hypothetical protein GCM10007111_24370 [Virgibacillus kapii]CDQ39118.1 hypothetical protein BN990_01401 [Virgibacillus massiliensis]
MKDIYEYVDKMELNKQLKLDEIPDLDLYMDQVIQLFENKFGILKRDEEEKVLTKTMINNYAKGKLFFPIENKKYSKNHLMLIAMIYQMKGALSINDVRMTLDALNKMITEENFDLTKLYESYVDIANDRMQQLKVEMKQLTTEVEDHTSAYDSKRADYLKQLLLVASFVNMSNYYRRAAEKIVDAIERNEK